MKLQIRFPKVLFRPLVIEKDGPYFSLIVFQLEIGSSKSMALFFYETVDKRQTSLE